MVAIKTFIFFFLFISIYSFDFGNTTVKLTKINGGTATLKIFPQFNGTTSGSDLTISNLNLACYPKFYKLICVSNKKLVLLTIGTEIQCSIEVTLTTSTACDLTGKPTILSTGDTFISIKDQIEPEQSKFGDTQIGLISVEGKKIIVKIYPKRSGETTTEDLFIHGLTMNNKALICQAGKKITLEANTGTELECSTSEEIDGNIKCSLGGEPKIFSTSDTFDKITYKTNIVYSSFGKVKIGLIMVKGTTITLELKPEYKGKIKSLDITGLELNNTSIIDCPSTGLELIKEGIQIECTISQAINENDLCILTQKNLKSEVFPKLEINEEKKTSIAKISKFGKVNISLTSVDGTSIMILIETTFFGITESNNLVIEGLKIHYDNKDYPMICKSSSKIDFNEYGNDFLCSVKNRIIGGKECSLKGVPIFDSEGDTFGEIKVSNNSVYSSFGKITINLISVIGKEVKIKLLSEFPGIAISSITSINNLKLNNNNLICPIGVNINFSDKPTFICNMTEIMKGNIVSQLKGNRPYISNPANSKDNFNEIILSTSTVLSSLGKLYINLISVIGNKVTIDLISEYVGEIIGLNVYSLYLNGKSLVCHSTGTTLLFKDEEGISDAKIFCEFSDSYYSQESNTLCTLTGTPYTSAKIFTSVVINTTTVTSGIRNFGETIIYLSSIKGTTVMIQIKPSLNGKVRPIISNLKLQGGTFIYDVKCDVADKKKLYKNSRTSIKCYIEKTINENTSCNLIKDNVSITSDSGDIFGNIIISTETINIKPKPPTFPKTQIQLNSIIGTQVNINIITSSTTSITNISPKVHGLYLGSSELYCVSTQALYFKNNTAQMSCTSPTTISCTNDCQLSGTPIIITSSEEEGETFGDTSLISKTITKTSSTLGNVSLSLKQVIGNTVYIGVTSTNNGKSVQNINIRNLYIDGQNIICDGNIEFSTSGTQIKCSISEPIPYNKIVSLTGTPSIIINSGEESVDLVQFVETQIETISKSNSALIIELISVKENIVTISIIANSLTEKTTFNNFTITGLAVNDLPLDIKLDNISLSNKSVNIQTKLNETIPRDVQCTLKGVSTSQILADSATFGPITSPSSNIINSSSFKFGQCHISLLYVQGKSVILMVSTTKTDYTKNTEINGLYINDNIPLLCKLDDNIEFSINKIYIECKLEKPMKPDIECYLSYKNDNNLDDNFEIIEIDGPEFVISQYKYFGNVSIGLKEVDGKNVKIIIKTEIQNITTTNNITINNLYINGEKIICKFYQYIEFSYTGIELNCLLNTLQNTESYTLTGNNIEIISFGDKFNKIIIDNKNNTIKTSPKEIDGLTISLSSIAGNKVNIKLKTSYEINTDIEISNLKIKNIENSNIYDISCPKFYINLNQENYYTNIITCTISTKIDPGLWLSLVDNNNEIKIKSYDKFDEIIIETNEIKTTKFGDINIDYLYSSIVLNISSIFEGETILPINIENIKLNSSLSLDCNTLDKIKINPTGTLIYCTLNGINTLQGINNKSPYIISGSIEDSYSNIYLNRNSNNNLKSTNCYSLNDKTSCESFNYCTFTKDTFGYCGIKSDYEFDSDESISEINLCILYINKDSCNDNDKCIWNEDYKYSCKTKQIKNCKKLNYENFNKCEQCESNYILNSEKNKCQPISITDTVHNTIDIIKEPCNKYIYEDICEINPQCEFIDKNNSYFYCSNIEQDEINNNCYLYIAEESCNSQEGCNWILNEEGGCKEKYLDNCLIIRKSDPTLCEKCKDGYYLSSGICKIKDTGEGHICNMYIDQKEKCEGIEFCEFSNKEYCYGEENCYLIIDEKECDETETCSWNKDKAEKCQIKKIDNCLRLKYTEEYKCEKWNPDFSTDTKEEKTECYCSKSKYIYQCIFILVITLLLL